MSIYWLRYNQSAKWSHQSRTQTCTVVFFERSIYLASSQPQPRLHPRRCTCLCCAYQHVRLCAGLRFLRDPAWCSQTAAVMRLNRLLKPFVLGPPRGPHQPTAKMVRWYVSSHVPHSCLHTCHQTRCDGLMENSILTSSADRRDVTSSAVLSAHCWAGASWRHK